jgi:ATP-dependent phosphofructokinase / diphosphate-dependent phosphofructokinase
MGISGKQQKQIAVITGGGDAPGLNAVIKGVVVKAKELGYDVLGFKQGWKGLIEDSAYGKLDLDEVEDIQMTGGTILGSSRTNPYQIEDGEKKIIESLKKNNCDYLIAIGGDDTLGVANKLFEAGVKVVGIPKTIDNDLSGTDCTFGFDTAINRAMGQIENLHTTAKSHERVIVVEVMGRHAGWLTLDSGLAGGAHYIILPEEKFDIEDVCNLVQKRKEQDKNYSIIAVSEGALPVEDDWFQGEEEKDSFGNVVLKKRNLAKHLAQEIEKRTGAETRYVVLGHTQRAGSPTAFDRVLGLRLGVEVIKLINQSDFGKMVSVRGTEIQIIELNEALERNRVVPEERIEHMKLFRG